MRTLLAFGLLAAINSQAIADTYVNGHFRQDGTYVQPHYRTNPDSTRLNNYGTQGNFNPHTGQQGTANPYALPSYNLGTPSRRRY